MVIEPVLLCAGRGVSERVLLSASDVLALPNPTWLASYVLPERSLSMLWGPPNVGKSFVTLDLACSIAKGDAWLKCETEPGHVIYVAGEGVSSFKRRLGAWCKFNCTDIEDLSNLSFINWPVQLHEGVDSFLRLTRPINPVLVIIDTLATASLGIDESSTEGIGATLKSLLKIRKELDSAVMVVHHTGWTKKGDEEEQRHERGSSTMRGIVDTSIQMREGKTSSQKILYCEKQRDAEEFDPIRLRLKEVHFKTRKGTPLKSLVPTVN